MAAAEACRNGAKLNYVHPPPPSMALSKNLWQINLHTSHMKFMGKNKVDNTMQGLIETNSLGVGNINKSTTQDTF